MTIKERLDNAINEMSANAAHNCKCDRSVGSVCGYCEDLSLLQDAAREILRLEGRLAKLSNCVLTHVQLGRKLRNNEDDMEAAALWAGVERKDHE